MAGDCSKDGHEGHRAREWDGRGENARPRALAAACRPSPTSLASPSVEPMPEAVDNMSRDTRFPPATRAAGSDGLSKELRSALRFAALFGDTRHSES